MSSIENIQRIEREIERAEDALATHARMAEQVRELLQTLQGGIVQGFLNPELEREVEHLQKTKDALDYNAWQADQYRQDLSIDLMLERGQEGA